MPPQKPLPAEQFKFMFVSAALRHAICTLRGPLLIPNIVHLLCAVDLPCTNYSIVVYEDKKMRPTSKEIASNKHIYRSTPPLSSWVGRSKGSKAPPKLIVFSFRLRPSNYPGSSSQEAEQLFYLHSLMKNHSAN